MSFYKNFSEHDRVVSTNPLYENVDLSLTTLHSSSYSPYNFTQYASGGLSYVNSEHLFDLTFGSSTGSVSLRNNIYNQFAKNLLGHNPDNSTKKFKLLEDVNKPAALQQDLPYAFIINLARSQTQDRIKEGSVEIEIDVSSAGNIKLVDANTYLHEGAGGHHYGVLSATSSVAGLLTGSSNTGSVGYIFYEAGVAIVSPYIFVQSGSSYVLDSFTTPNVCGVLSAGNGTYATNLSSSINGTATITSLNDFLSAKLKNISYTSVTELNSTIYFCRAYNHEFNYSSNPTYLKDSEIIVKNGDPQEPSRAYITTVGLYSDDNQLLAVAKLSEPILKTKENELIARVRLDF